MKTLALALLASTIASSAFALEQPAPGKDDPRCRQAEYQDGNIVGITSYAGRAMFIKLDPLERIEKFMAGDNSGTAPIAVPSSMPQNNDQPPMNNQPLHSTLPLWAVRPGKTNVVIISLLTDELSEHTYMIEIEVKPQPPAGKDDADATYCLKFTYNQERQQQAQQQALQQAKLAPGAAVKRRADIEKEKAEARLAQDPFYGEQNYKYVAIGDHSIAPTQASDNFAATAFRFPGHQSRPAIFIADSPPWCDLTKPPPDWFLKAPERKTTTEPVPMDDMMIIHETAQHFRLRMGNQSEAGQENGHVVDISNCGWNPFRGNPGTGTDSPNVVRQVITAR